LDLAEKQLGPSDWRFEQVVGGMFVSPATRIEIGMEGVNAMTGEKGPAT
jgi:hypothetical protein